MLILCIIASTICSYAFATGNIGAFIATGLIGMALVKYLGEEE
jgi:hypothetical protein